MISSSLIANSLANGMARNMHDGMTAANIADSNDAVGRYFDLHDILHTHPINPLIEDSAIGADREMIDYGMILAAMSQYANMSGLSHSFNVVESFMDDSSDGHMDGRMGEDDIVMGRGMTRHMNMPSNAGTELMAEAMEEFIQSPINRSGISEHDMGPLINMLRLSDGIIE